MTLKRQMAAKLTAANAPSAAQLARETGLSAQNLSRWMNEAKNASAFAEPGVDIMEAWIGALQKLSD